MASNARKNLDGIELRKCCGCGFIFSARVEYVYEELFAKYYADASRDGLVERARNQGHDRLVAEIVAKSGIHKGARVLDFGSGVGLIALMFQDSGMDVVAVEESRKYVEKHASLGITSFRSTGEATKNYGLFDLVVMKDVLEHLSEPKQTLADVVACVRPGGYLYVRVPNVYAYRFHWAIDTKGHINHFSPAILSGLFEKLGMQKIAFVDVYDIRSRAGKLYHSVFWPAREFIPLYHQISILFRANQEIGNHQKHSKVVA